MKWLNLFTGFYCTYSHIKWCSSFHIDLLSPHSKCPVHIFPSSLLIQFRTGNDLWAIPTLVAQTSAVHMEDILAMSLVSGNNSRRILVQAFRLNTAWNRESISNESSCRALARDPHQYPTHAGGQVLWGNSQLNIVSSILGALGVVDICFSASLCVLSPRLPSCFWHSYYRGRVQCAVAPTCTPATEKQLWSGTTSLVQLKEKERPAWLFPTLFTLAQSSTPGHLYNGQTFLR